MFTLKCLFLHNFLEYYPGNGVVIRECKRCGLVEKRKLLTIHQVINYFGNYDKAIWFCQKNQEVYE